MDHFSSIKEKIVTLESQFVIVKMYVFHYQFYILKEANILF